MQTPGMIDGKTRVVAHLAYPSDHLRTPPLFNARCRALGLNAVLVPWQVHPDNLATVLDALRVSESVVGVIVTIPHKETVAALCDSLEGPASHLGAVNIVRKDDGMTWRGRMLDGVGFVQGLDAAGHKIAGRHALLVGAGGVGVAIADALAEAGVAKLTISNRTPERAERLADKLRKVHTGVEISTGPADATGVDLVVNATSVGMKRDDPLPLDPETIAEGAIVAEVVMEPEETALLQAAALRGAIAHQGKHMLTGQIDAFVDYLLPEIDAPRADPGTDTQDHMEKAKR